MQHNFPQRALEYAQSIVDKSIPACEHVINSCQRFIDDIERQDIALNIDKAQEWCEFLEKLPHVKGKWAAQKLLFVLSPWQIFCVVNIYGWYFVDSGKRRFREAYIEVPRKNGKTYMLSGLAIGAMTIEGEFGAEVYCGATSEKQAMEVFTPAKAICNREPDLRAAFGLTVNAKSLTVLNNGSKFEPVIGNPGDGSSPSLGIADEFHEHKDSDLVDTFITGMGARENPLMLYITTAGSDTGGPCYSVRSDVIKILKGSVNDDNVFGIIYGLDEDDQWDTVDAQIKANPNYGVSVDADFLKGQLEQAKRSATKQTAYKTKHLNLWVGAKSAWMNMLAFQATRKAKLNIEDFKGRKCYIAIDLASKIDIADMCILFPPEHGGNWAAFFKHYLPEERILDGGNTRYKAWHSEGWLTATPGNVTDFSYIEDDLRELKSDYEIMELPYDPFQATQFSTRMMDEGFPMIEYGATVKNFSEPMKYIEALILSKDVEFEKDPVLMWMFGNVVATLDKKDNIFPNKERPENKIDGVVALIMAMGRAIVNNESPNEFEAEVYSV